LSQKFISILSEEYNLDQIQEEILSKNSSRLKRPERRVFFETLKPREREFKIFLKEKYEQLNKEDRRLWLDTTVNSLLKKGGESAIIDSLLMDVIGRLEVYKNLRQRSEDEGQALKPLVNFGGLSFVLVTMVIITAFILYFFKLY